MKKEEFKSRVRAAWNVFGDSYGYRRMYNEYKAMRAEQEKEALKSKKPSDNNGGAENEN